MRDRPYPALPLLSDGVGLTDADKHRLMSVLFRDGLINPLSRATISVEKNGKPWRDQVHVVSITAAHQPADGANGERSSYTLPDAGAIHISFGLKDGNTIGINEALEGASPARQATSIRQFVITDADGLCWQVDPEGQIPPRSLSPFIPAIVALDSFGDEDLRDLRLHGNASVTGAFAYGRLNEIAAHDGAETNGLLGAVSLVELRRARRQRIAEIASRHFSEAACLRLISVCSPGKAYTAHDDFDRRTRFNLLQREMIYNFLLEMREAGLLKPCPNNGPRKVYGLTEWNAWVNAPAVKPSYDPVSDRIGKVSLWRFDTAPVWKMIENQWVRSGLDEELRQREACHPGVAISISSEEYPLVVTSETAGQFARAISSDLVSAISMEVATHNHHLELISEADGSRFELWDSVFEPVLATRGPDHRQPLHVAPEIEAPAPGRHLELPVPSGRLFCADWPRIPGFNEVIKRDKEKYFAISTEQGRRDEQKYLFTTFGVLKIQVGNTSPSAFPVGDRVWRLGSEVSEASAHSPQWSTCTDLWANTYVDMGQLASVLMASGKYAREADAIEAIETYAANTYGATILDVPEGALNFYVLNGKDETHSGFTKLCRLKEVPHDRDFHDHYVISARPLKARAKDFVEHEWVAAGPLEPSPFSGVEPQDDPADSPHL